MLHSVIKCCQSTACCARRCRTENKTNNTASGYVCSRLRQANEQRRRWTRKANRNFCWIFDEQSARGKYIYIETQIMYISYMCKCIWNITWLIGSWWMSCSTTCSTWKAIVLVARNAIQLSTSTLEHTQRADSKSKNHLFYLSFSWSCCSAR